MNTLRKKNEFGVSNKSKGLTTFLFLLGFMIAVYAAPSDKLSFNERKQVWSEFRQKNPFNYQTVGLKRYSDGSALIIISEPSENATINGVKDVFYSLSISPDIQIYQHPIGYDGWLKDMVISVQNMNDQQTELLKSKLFKYLYGTDYKAAFQNLDVITKHTNFSQYDLNIQVSAEELNNWFIDEQEVIMEVDNLSNKTTLANCFFSTNMVPSVYYSENTGFVVWLIDNAYIDEESFKVCARKFSLDSDLVLGAISFDERTAIIGRERIVPLHVLPPMRTETLLTLASTTEEDLSQSYERSNIFSGKLDNHKDYAPIYLSDELWHTEYGSILNMTDQMLKSWSENGIVEYDGFGYKKPIDWAFVEGVCKDLHASQLTYNWNTAGAGYCIGPDSENPYKIYAVNRTGSLPVSYIPDGFKNITETDSIYLAEELAYDFFSELSNPELVKVAEYASFFQIFKNFGIHIEKTVNAYPQVVTTCRNEEQLNAVLESICDFHDRGLDSLEGKPHYDTIQIHTIENYYDNKLNELLSVCDDSEDSLAVMMIMLFAAPADNLIHEIDSVNDVIYYLKDEIVYKDKMQALLEFLDEIDEKYDEANIIKAFEKKGTPFLRSVSHFIINPREIDVISIYEKVQNGIENLSMYEVSQLVALKMIDKKDEIIRYASVLGILELEDAKEALLAENSDKSLTWIKCPTIVQSTHRSQDSLLAIGGHDLSSKITPIRMDKNLNSGQCRVEFIEGKKVVFISPSDKGRITPDFIRRVERTESTGIHTIESPSFSARPRDIMTTLTENRSGRGFNISDHGTVIEMNKVGGLVLNGHTINTTEELFQDLAYNVAHHKKNSPKKIVFKNISEDLVETIIDGTNSYVLERNEEFNVANKCYNFVNATYQKQSDGTTLVSIPLEGSQIKAKYSTHVFKMPTAKVEGFKSIIQEMLSNPDGVWNRFKYKRKMKSLNIQKSDIEDWIEHNKVVILIDGQKHYLYDELIKEEIV